MTGLADDFRLAVERLAVSALPDPQNPGRERRAFELVLRAARFHVGAMPVIVRVGLDEAPVVEVSADQTRLVAYFFEPPPEGGRVTVSQLGNTLAADEPFTRRWLDRPPPIDRFPRD